VQTNKIEMQLFIYYNYDYYASFCVPPRIFIVIIFVFFL